MEKIPGPYSDLVEKYKPDMLDLNSDDPPIDLFDRFDVVQIKMDGWFTILKIVDHHVTVITSGGEVRQEFDIKGPLKDALILCEWIYGTNWSLSSVYNNYFLAHDILEENGTSYENQSYWYRYERLDWVKEIFIQNNIKFAIIQSFPSKDWGLLWNRFVRVGEYEGLVFKNSLQTWPMKMGRMKPVVDEDYVVIGFKEGNNRLTGTLGAIEGGMYVDGKLVRICTVGGGFTDEMRDDIWSRRDYFMGRVFTARGKVRFSSGALRHPNFWDWRDDKKPEECVWPKI